MAKNGSYDTLEHTKGCKLSFLGFNRILNKKKITALIVAG